jgi:two-component system CheB/CheR fusion protein
MTRPAQNPSQSLPISCPLPIQGSDAKPLKFTSAVGRTAVCVQTIYIVDDNAGVRDLLTDILEDEGYVVRAFSEGGLLLQDFDSGDADCILVDEQMPGMNGIELIRWLKSITPDLPVILVTGNATLEASVSAMKAGAVDFIQKPFKTSALIGGIETALFNSERRGSAMPDPIASASRDYHLTQRQCEILERVLDGQPSKIIAADLGISQRTVENHRAAIMRKTGSKSIPGLVRLLLSWIPAV